jgi:hypothetical protein
MTENKPQRRPRPGRARKRAIRAQARNAGVPYSVATRQLEALGLAPGEMLATTGRTVYPVGTDSYRLWSIEQRERRSLEERVADTRRAAVLPAGRAGHLAERFPPTRGRDGSGVGPLYHGEGRLEILAMLYLTAAYQAPGLVPAIGDLAWIAEMGEETALDTACADLDRTVRLLLDQEPVQLWAGVEAALAFVQHHGDWRMSQEAVRLTALYQTMMTPREGRNGEPYVEGRPLDGVRQILDALLVVADDGHAPGTRVRLLTPPYDGSDATIVSVRWSRSGPPIAYVVSVDGARTLLTAEPASLVVLAQQELLSH